MKKYISKITFVLFGFVAGVAFLISCGGSSGSGVVSDVDAAEPQYNVALLKDANGVYIGRVIGMIPASQAYVLTDQGYRTIFRMGSGQINNVRQLYFESADCTGDAYITTAGQLGMVFSPYSDVAITYLGEGNLFYSTSDAQPVTINTQSTINIDHSFCEPHIATDDEAYIANRNDPVVTGVQSTAYAPRMKIE